MLTLYYCFVYPYVTYCLEVWGQADKKYTNSILKLQKLCCRIISGASRLTSSKLLFDSLNILCLSKLYEYVVALFMLKFYHGHLPKLYDNIFRKKREEGYYNHKKYSFA